MLGFAVIGLLLCGAVGVLKAISMESGIDVLLCLLGSVLAFGAVYHICFGMHFVAFMSARSGCGKEGM